MNELTQNTINFCKHHAPFKGESTAGGGQVRDCHGLTMARCERIDDAWTIAEALNAVVPTAVPQVFKNPPLEVCPVCGETAISVAFHQESTCKGKQNP